MNGDADEEFGGGMSKDVIIISSESVYTDEMFLLVFDDVDFVHIVIDEERVVVAKIGAVLHHAFTNVVKIEFGQECGRDWF